MPAAPSKVCKRCSRELPLLEFYARASAPDGRQSWCKQCSRSARAKWAHDNRDRMRELDRRTYERRMADPERAAIERTRKREWQRANQNRTGQRRRVREGRRTKSPIVDPSPLGRWLAETLKARGMSFLEAAEIAAVDGRKMSKLAAGTWPYAITLDFVDRVLIALHGPHLDELYGEDASGGEKGR